MYTGQRAQNVVEYGLLIATIVLVILLAVPSFSSQIQLWFQYLATRITTS
ncbi:MAG: hypothetical protein JOZ81_19930 [Chloroflexi bacterium]|nr:hypothetical protein [Chloroflexota bacterium]